MPRLWSDKPGRFARAALAGGRLSRPRTGTCGRSGRVGCLQGRGWSVSRRDHRRNAPLRDAGGRGSRGGRTPRQVQPLREEKELPGVFLVHVRPKTAAFLFAWCLCTSTRPSLTSSPAAAGTGAPCAGPAPLPPPERPRWPKRAFLRWRTWWMQRKATPELTIAIT